MSGYDPRLFKDQAYLRSMVGQCVLLKDVDSLLELDIVLGERKLLLAIVCAGLAQLGVHQQGPTNAAWSPPAGPSKRRGRPRGRMTPEAAAQMRAKREATLLSRRASV